MARKPQYDDQIYDAVVEHWTLFSQPPTMEHLMDNTDALSKSTVRQSLLRLERNGLVKLIKGKAIPAGISITFQEKV